MLCKKGRGTRKEVTLSSVRQENIYLAIQAVQQERGCSIQLLCEIAGLSRSSYYKWQNRKPSRREVSNMKLTQVMLLLYEKVERIFGYRRLALHLHRQMNQPINAKRLYRLMKLQGIQ
ncbi:hypothetical protein D3C75_695290 [compost metagenome]